MATSARTITSDPAKTLRARSGANLGCISHILMPMRNSPRSAARSDSIHSAHTRGHGSLPIGSSRPSGHGCPWLPMIVGSSPITGTVFHQSHTWSRTTGTCPARKSLGTTTGLYPPLPASVHGPERMARASSNGLAMLRTDRNGPDESKLIVHPPVDRPRSRTTVSPPRFVLPVCGASYRPAPGTSSLSRAAASRHSR